MSNARVFAWAWCVAVMLLTVGQWFGFGRPPGLLSLIGKMAIGAHIGVAAVAFFGDRDQRKDAA